MTAKKIYIVRHGETDFNRMSIVQGSGVDTDLNENGKQQAELFFRRYGSIPFGHVFTSALKRSQQSVKGFIDKGLPHTALAALNEICWGDFEGKYQTEEEKKVYWDMIAKWSQGELDLKINNGESPREMAERQKPAIAAILSCPANDILVCMHGRAMKSLLCQMLDVPLTRMEEFQHVNMCLYLLEWVDEGLKLVKANNTEHLLQP
jgi:probable phosphoglycerate mutase